MAQTEDSDNALLLAAPPRSSIVSVNPLAAITAGNQAAQAEFTTRGMQAQQAWGDILQQATDENGNVDYQKAQKLAAAAGPIVQMKMMESLKETSALRGQQLAQVSAAHTLFGQAGASLMNDPSNDNVAKIRAALVTAGAPASALAEIDRIGTLSEPERRAEAYKHVVGHLSSLDQLNRSPYAAPTLQNTGTAIQPIITTPGSPYGPPGTTVAPGGVGLGLSPAELDKEITYTDANNQPQHTTLREYLKTLGTPAQPGGAQVGAPGGAGGPPAIPGSGRYTPPPPALVGPGTTTPAPAPTPAPGAPAPAPYTGGGFGGVLAPGASPGPQSMNLPPGASPALAAIEAGRLQAATGTPASAMPMVAGPGAGPTAQPLRPVEPGWGTGTTGVMPPAGDPSAVPPPPALGAAPRPAVAAPPAVPAASGRSIPGPPAGQGPAAIKTAEESSRMGSTLVSRADQVPTNKANYANMLSDLDRIGNMPPGGEKQVAIETFLQKATGYGFTMNRDQIAAANSFAKLANIAVGQQLAAIGGTDARQALFMGSNPNLDLSKLGNQQIIHMLQGNEDAIQAKSRAWVDWSKSHGTDSYQQFQDDFNHHFDPRVFQQQYMGPSEIADLRKSLTGPGAEQKFVDDVKYARSRGWVK